VRIKKVSSATTGSGEHRKPVWEKEAIGVRGRKPSPKRKDLICKKRLKGIRDEGNPIRGPGRGNTKA